ncbi:hypothetical protein [Streptomyces sp. NPDC058667]|uniref:hypothetical protein n=1 Tax=Streptomyces sp. NPDC058667 TaxID=3346588 RepID=UPI00365EC4D2
MLGTGEFSASGGAGPEQAVKKLIEDQALEGSGRALGYTTVCSTRTETVPSSQVTVYFDLYKNAADLFDDGTKWTAQGRYLYGMGLETSANNRTADLFLACSSARLKGPEERPVPLHSWLRFDKPVKGAYPANTPATREAYLTVLHSVTLAVVKELGCESNAGLGEKPTFEAKKWRGEQ